jgi:hypothetical protein
MGTSKFKPPFRIAGVISEQDTFDGLDFRREVLVFPPIPDRSVANTNSLREALRTPLSSRVIDFPTRSGASQQMPIEQPSKSPLTAV